ncbi:MAG: hypothetical protein ACOC4I_02435 [Spirochaetota bacterium]
MRTILLVDESDLLRVSISVDDSPHPVPRFIDLKPRVQDAARNADAVFYVAPHHDPVIITADGAIEGQYRWEDIGSVALMFNRSASASRRSREDPLRRRESVQE